MNELHAKFERLNAERAERRDRVDLLRFQIGELEGAQLAPGEHAELRDERDLLRNAADLRAELGSVAAELAESDHALLDRLRAALHVAERWSAKVQRVEGPLEDLRAAEIHVNEAAAALTSIVDGVVDDPARLDAVEERLAELERLETKYRTDEAGLLELLAELGNDLAVLEADDASLESLEDAAQDREGPAAIERRRRIFAARRLGAEARLRPVEVDGDVLRGAAALLREFVAPLVVHEVAHRRFEKSAQFPA